MEPKPWHGSHWPGGVSWEISGYQKAIFSLLEKLVRIPDPRAGNPPFTEVLKAVQKHRATVLPAAPTIMVAFNNHAKLHQYDLTSLKACFCGGAPPFS